MASDYELAQVLGEFARTMVTDFPIQGILDRLVERIVEIMPITAAGVTLITPGVEPRYVAASNDAALRYEKLQTELDEGPCLAAYRSGTAVAVADLQHDTRFTKFTPRALTEGLRAAFTFPLRHAGQQLGALDLYRDSPGALTPEAMAAAQTLADVAAAYLINAQARADLQDSSDRSRHAALHDGLTGLPNRALMLERLEHAFLRGHRSGLVPAVFFVDLDRFKWVNDTYGHRAGDELLVAVAERLTGILRSGDTLARLSGDEFVILCEDVGTSEQADRIVTRVADALAEPFVLSSTEVTMTASVGIAFVDRADVAPEQLLQDADLAMYRAKRQGLPHRPVFDLRDQHMAEHQGRLEQDLQTASERRQLHVAYQPIVANRDGRITGVEALLRWTHPNRGLVPPSVVIPIAEQSGLINQIGRWVLERAWSDQHRWQTGTRAGYLTMSVNVSAQQLMSPGFVDAVAAVLEAVDTDPGLLTLEVTESVFVRDSERALLVINDLKALGVMIALDDFGTGYSSLSYLKQFPVDTVKIDRTFVTDLGHDPTSHTIVAAVVQLAHGLGMTVVAEGVETLEQFREVAGLGCDSSQGYYFARPMPRSELDHLLRTTTDEGGLRLPALPGRSGR